MAFNTVQTHSAEFPLSTFHVWYLNMLIDGKLKQSIIKKANMESMAQYFPSITLLGLTKLIMKLRLTILTALLLLIFGGITLARECPQPPDEDLASHEMIVVAKWNPTTITSRGQSAWNTKLNGLEQKKSEQFTTLEVIRTIKGDLKPGKHTIRIPNFLISFEIIKESKGPTLYWFGSSEHPGAVDDVTVPCLWFMNKTKSWTTEDTNIYPTLTNLFGVQPLSKEEHFRELMKK